jgi:hypothetical protein
MSDILLKYRIFSGLMGTGLGHKIVTWVSKPWVGYQGHISQLNVNPVIWRIGNAKIGRDAHR